MGLFGGKKNTQPRQYQQPVPSYMKKYRLSQEAMSLKSKLEFTMKALMWAPGKIDEKTALAANVVIMEQNEVIIKYLDDISKSLDELSKKSE